MKVSIIIPAYNAENSIKRCLESIIDQSYSNLEIIVVNDGSTDSTLSILKTFTVDKRIIIIDQKNAGTYRSRKAGLQNSTGEVVFNVDADDFLEPGSLQLLVKKMKASKADMVIGNNYEWKNGKKKLIRNKLPPKQNKLELVKNLLNNNIKGYIWGKLIKRNLLIDIDYQVPRLLQEDVLFNLHVFLKKEMRVALEPTPVYNYVIHEKSANSSTNPIFIENVFAFIGIAHSLIKEAGLLEKLQDEFKLFTCRNWIVYSRLGGKLAKNRSFRGSFYTENFTSYVQLNLALHHKIEMVAYRYHYGFGRMMTDCMKQLNNLIFYTHGGTNRRKEIC